MHSWNHTQQQPAIDAVMIGERDHGVHAKLLLNLILLQFISRAWAQRWSPVTLLEIDL